MTLRDVDTSGDDTEQMRKIVGGWLAIIRGAGWHMWLDEEGGPKGLVANERASILAHALGWGGLLVGPVVFVGTRMRSGMASDGDVPEYVLDAARELGFDIADETT